MTTTRDKLNRAIEEALVMMTDRQREVFLMHADGHSTRAITQLPGMPTNHVSVYRILVEAERKVLRQILAEFDIQPGVAA